MYKHSPSRSQRSRGIKVKHVLQICLLIALCCWLIYQVKRSHGKKREFGDSANASLATEQKDGVVKLGRKYLNPQMKDKVIKTGKQDEEEEEEEETTVEEEDIKQEEMEEPKDNKIDEEDIDEGRDGGEEIDDHEQEKSDTDDDQEVDFVDVEKERENVDEEELEEKDAKDNKGQTENDSASQEHYKKGGGITNTREENYNADDASSAVTHDTRIATADNQTRIMGKSNQQAYTSEFDHQTQSINPDEIGAGKNPPVVESGETANNGSYLAAISTSNGTNAVRIEDVVEGNKNARKGAIFQNVDNKLEGNSTLPGSNDLQNFNLTINIDSKDIDPTRKESKKSDVTESSVPKIWSNVSANASGKTEEAFDDSKDKGAAAITEEIDESDSETSDELQADLIDSSDSTDSLEENYI